MSRTAVRFAWAAVVTAAGAGAAGAQPPVPGGAMGYGGAATPPAFSPYLNIVGGFGTPAFNYFGIVRPQVAARQAILGLEGAVANNRQAIANVQAGLAGGEYNLSPTGHSTVFLNTGGYFLGGGPRQGLAAGVGAAPAGRGARGGGR